MPGSGADLYVHDGGFGVAAEEVLQDQVRVGTGAVGGVQEAGAVKGGEEGADGVVVGGGGERGVKGEFGGAAGVVVFVGLEGLVEFSKIVDEWAQDSVLGLVPGHLVLRDLEHFYNGIV